MIICYSLFFSLSNFLSSEKIKVRTTSYKDNLYFYIILVCIFVYKHYSFSITLFTFTECLSNRHTLRSRQKNKLLLVCFYSQLTVKNFATSEIINFCIYLYFFFTTVQQVRQEQFDRQYKNN
jgi:hypothetical protein